MSKLLSRSILSSSSIFLTLLLLTATPTAAQVDPDYVFTITDGVGFPGGEVDLEFVIDSSEGDDIQGWQFAICHDVDVLSLEDGAVDTSNQDTFGLSWTFYSCTYQENASGDIIGYRVGGLLNVISMYVLEPGINTFYDATYGILSDAELGTTSMIEWCLLGSPAVTTRAIVGGSDIEPVTNDGEVRVEAGFRRGDVNGNGSTSALEDVVALLEWGFLEGTTPPCLDAADSNDDGVVLPLSDATVLIFFAFQGGPAPPAPGTEECGADPTEDDLDCETPPDCE